MSNRVLLDSNGLKVSFPGRNALTDSDRDLLFTSNWPTLGVTDEGSHLVNWNTGGNTRSYDQSVYFSTPYSSLPATQMSIVTTDGTRTLSSGNIATISKIVFQQIGSSTGTIALLNFGTIVHTDRIQFVGNWQRNSPAYTIPNFRIFWKAFAYSY